VGPAIAQKVAELVKTGRSETLEALLEAYPPGFLSLLALPELGPRKAAALWEMLHIGSIAELEQACKDGRVRGLKGFGVKSETKILEGIARAAQGGDRRLLGDVLPRAEALLRYLRTLPEVQRSAVGGSIRRFAETVADVDLVVSTSAPEKVLEHFATHPDVAEVRGRGETGCSVRLRSPPLQVDLRVLPDEDFATALHHFTGSKAHHIRLRGRALERGLKISEWGVLRGEEKLPVPDEAALYRLLDLPEIPPELREDAGELEAAEAGKLPSAFLELQDIRGLVHSHSTWSDGKASLEHMAKEAKARGFEYLTVTEHSAAASYAGGLTPERLQQQWAEIDRLNQALHPFRLLKGLEVDILREGTLDLPDALLEQLEVVIGSIHVRHGLDEEGMTRRVLAALDHPCLDILGHPTGRLIHEREPYALRMGDVVTKAAQRRVALEVNGNPHRLDLKAEHVRQALQVGAQLVASVDSHSVPELDHLRYAVGTARRGWATRADVLNTHSADALLAEIQLRRSQRRQC
jgi:DNA polymerase (family 10)